MDSSAKCPNCGNELSETTSTEPYHFTTCGLDNVYLVDVKTANCKQCQEKIVEIPNPTTLLRVIGQAIILKDVPLSSKEIRFLRKNLFMKIGEFAEYLGVTRQAVSRWENGQKAPGPVSDRFIRAFYSQKANLPKEIQEKTWESFREQRRELETLYSWLCTVFPEPHCEMHRFAA